MNADLFKQLFVLSFTAPREAGKRIIALNLPIQALWIALGLVSILLTAAFTIILFSLPVHEEQYAELQDLMPAFQSPLIVALQNWGQAIISVFLYHWIGRMLGGRGRLDEMLAVMIWLQALVLAIVILIGVLALTLPVLAGLLVIFAAFWVFWANVAFIDAAHRFENMFLALAAFAIALLVLMVGPLIVLSLVGNGV